MKYLFYCTIIFLCCSCTKDYNSQYTAVIINNTTHSIKILFFKNGVVSSDDTVRISQNQQFEIASGTQRGNIKAPGFTSKYFGGNNDSVIVLFDNLYKISHYVNAPIQKAPKHYLYSSPRNIQNVLSYRFVTTSTSKNSIQNDHYYDFKEQDYLDAL